MYFILLFLIFNIFNIKIQTIFLSIIIFHTRGKRDVPINKSKVPNTREGECTCSKSQVECVCDVAPR